MTPEIELFQKTIDKLVGAFRARRPVTLQPSEKLADALESGGRIVKTEIDRRKNSGKLGGRPRKDRRLTTCRRRVVITGLRLEPIQT
jgi:hypothetical protein